MLKRLPGDLAIGHNRYSTAGSSEVKNAQPFEVEAGFGSLAVAHNGNIVNAHDLHVELEHEGAIFQSTMDTEVIVHLMARADHPDLPGRLVAALRRVKGSYSLLIVGEDQLLAVRDPNGFRPLVLGRLKDSFVFASETCALDLIGASFEREVDPGELIVVDREGMRSFRPFGPASHALRLRADLLLAPGQPGRTTTSSPPPTSSSAPSSLTSMTPSIALSSPATPSFTGSMPSVIGPTSTKARAPASTICPPRRRGSMTK